MKWPSVLYRAGLHRYKLRLVFEVVDLPLALPAVVNHHEARAYANWLSAKQVCAPLHVFARCCACLLGEPEPPPPEHLPSVAFPHTLTCRACVATPRCAC